jgi:hypothetical protein
LRDRTRFRDRAQAHRHRAGESFVVSRVVFLVVALALTIGIGGVALGVACPRRVS